MAYYDEYTWIFGLTVVFAFIAAVGIGANDLANSFGTTIGARALTIWQIVILAAICEFAGAVLLGSGVTSTIKSGVAKTAAFTSSPTLLLYGFMCVSATSAFWDNFASQTGLPVSSTHTTVGATVGMALVLRGGSAVIWSQHKDEFPHVGGMVPIFLSWIVTPIMAAIICSILYLGCRHLILRSPNGFKRAFYAMPIFVGSIAWLIAAFVIQSGSKNKTWKTYSDGFATWVGAVCGVGCALFTIVAIMPVLRRKILAAEEHESKLAEQYASDPEGLKAAQQADIEAGDPLAKFLGKHLPESVKHNVVTNAICWNLRQDVHRHVDTNKHVGVVHENAEVFDVKTEAMFRYLQVFSAAVMSFTHGANDVSNAMGPFAAVYAIWKDGSIGKSVTVQTWILAVGGAGIVVGLAFFSGNIMGVLGVKVVKITSARGFCAEYATAITVAVASRYGLPVSTTQTVTGALLALGLWEGVKGINWRVAFKIFAGWVLTLFFACGLCALLVALGVNSPERSSVDNVVAAAKSYNTTNTAMLKTLFAKNDAGAAALNATFYKVYKNVNPRLPAVVSTNLDIFKSYNTSIFP